MSLFVTATCAVALTPVLAAPTLKELDPVPMVTVPGGPFLMGSENPKGRADEWPQRSVHVDTFAIDQVEVTNERYMTFVATTGHRSPPNPYGTGVLVSAKGIEQLPVVQVTWYDAKAYCSWAKKRLPTEAEWEKAARGEGKRRYAWGDEFVVGYANIDGNEDGFRYLAPPGSFESGRSPYGIYDMTGNVGEWVADFYDENSYRGSPYRDPKGPDQGEQRVIRGGSWRETKRNVRSSKRFQAKPWRHDITVGFRCAKDIEADVVVK